MVDKGGKITEVKAINDVGNGCAKAAEDAFRKLSDWNPKIERGQP